jgi:hypothetical protein
MENEDYYLVSQHHEQIGELYLWQFGTGGGGPFYSEHLIMDIILPERLVYHLASELQSACAANRVSYEEFSAAEDP